MSDPVTMREREKVRHRSVVVWPVLGLIAMVTYNTWALWEPVNGHAHILDGYLSELSASDQPGDFFFRGGDLATSLIVGALGIRALLVWREREYRRWWLVSGWALGGFAVATFFDAFFAMDCSPILNERCAALEDAGRLSAIHYAHTYTSVAAETAIVTSLIAAYLGVRRRYPRSLRRRRLMLAACAVEVIALIVMLIMIDAKVPLLGFPQMIMVLVASLWFAAVGFGVLGPPRVKAEELASEPDQILAG